MKLKRCCTVETQNGFLTYKCAECSATKTVPLACKSRICSQCGKKHADQWADELVRGTTNA
ncbi:MAG: transposase zinc-binding domain-containing protein [Nitrososphaerota archaeon]|nr:transposase zinc-binding domain-containing protein [Nitrososphaerota archaeon]